MLLASGWISVILGAMCIRASRFSTPSSCATTTASRPPWPSSVRKWLTRSSFKSRGSWTSRWSSASSTRSSSTHCWVTKMTFRYFGWHWFLSCPIYIYQTLIFRASFQSELEFNLLKNPPKSQGKIARCTIRLLCYLSPSLFLAVTRMWSRRCGYW